MPGGSQARNALAAASAGKAKVPALPVIQQNNPLGAWDILCVAPSFPKSGQLPIFIGTLGEKVDLADELKELAFVSPAFARRVIGKAAKPQD